MKRKIKTLRADTVINLISATGKLVDTYTHFSDTVMIFEFRSMSGLGPAVVTIPPETRRKYRVSGDFNCLSNRYRVCIFLPTEDLPDEYRKEAKIDA
jgi:hypothetical protein